MSSSQSKKRKGGVSSSQTTTATPETIPDVNLSDDKNEDDADFLDRSITKDDAKETGKYLEHGTKKKVKEFWQHFKLYVTPEGKHRAECLYCPRTYAPDPNKNGTKNMSKHFKECTENPANKGKGKHSTLIFESVDGKSGEGRLKNWVLNVNDVRDAISYMVILDELPFRFVEKLGFKHLMSVACPEFALPSRMTIARDCYQLYLNEKRKLKELFNSSCQRVCVTTDSWTSIQRLNYMCLTAHFIDKEWKLHKRIINFCPIASHKGEAIAKAVEVCLEDWGLDRKLFTITVDNASSNDTACRHLRSIVEKKGAICVGKYLHMRCIAHIVNLIAWDGLKMKEHVKPIDRIRAAVKFVRSSPARLQRFKECALILKIESKSLLSLDVSTRWNSTYIMLNNAIKFERVFGMLQLHKEPELLEIGCPGDNDWVVAKRLVIFLKKFYVLTNNVSGSLSVTSNSALFNIGSALDTLNRLDASGDEDFQKMAKAMKEKFDKYWGNVEKFNMLIYMAAVLDPNVKMFGVQVALRRMYGTEKGDILHGDVKEVVYELFDEYKALYAPTIAPSVGLSSDSMNILSIDDDEDDDDGGAASMKRDILDQIKRLKTSSGSRDDCVSVRPEFERYSNEEIGEDEEKDVLNWWQLNGPRFPVLSRMTRDILAMPVSTVASESASSTGGRTLDQFRSSLTPKMVQALVCGQDWLRASSRQISVEESLEELENIEKGFQKISIVEDPTRYVSEED